MQRCKDGMRAGGACAQHQRCVDAVKRRAQGALTMRLPKLRVIQAARNAPITPAKKFELLYQTWGFSAVWSVGWRGGDSSAVNAHAGGQPASEPGSGWLASCLLGPPQLQQRQ